MSVKHDETYDEDILLKELDFNDGEVYDPEDIYSSGQEWDEDTEEDDEGFLSGIHIVEEDEL